MPLFQKKLSQDSACGLYIDTHTRKETIMSFTTRLATAAAFAALLAWSSPAHAQGKGSKTKVSKTTKTKKSAKNKTAKTTLPKTKDYDFMADDIEGGRVLPNLDNLTGRTAVKHASLIRLRQHFIPEILRSADML